MQKKWLKKKKQAERESLNKAKAAKLVKLRSPEPEGFRRIHLGTDVYLWRYFGMKVEIRTPNGKKWVVPIWIIQGLPDQEAWEKEHEDSDGDRGYAYAIAPSMVRGYIDAMVRLC